jgi:L-iditol 2-dehydrogenase
MLAMELAGPGRLRPVHVEEPLAADLAPGQVLVQVAVGGICGSDLPHVRGTALDPPAPRPGYPLHETTGIALASRHRGIVPGDAVTGWATGFDGMAERIISDGAELHSYDAVRWTPAQAMIIQPLACAIYAVRRLGEVRGRRAAVLGLGSMGLLIAQVLATSGAEVVGVDRVDRTAAAAALGLPEPAVADAVAWAAALAPSEHADLVIEAIGHATEPLAAAIRMTRPEGVVTAFGVPDQEIYPVPVTTLFRGNLTLLAGVTRERMRMLRLAEEHLLRFPELADIVTDVLPLADAQSAFERAMEPRTGQLKVLLRMEEEAA